MLIGRFVHGRFVPGSSLLEFLVLREVGRYAANTCLYSLRATDRGTRVARKCFKGVSRTGSVAVLRIYYSVSETTRVRAGVLTVRLVLREARTNRVINGLQESIGFSKKY